MKSTLLTTDANFIAAAALGALSFGAMLSLAHALPCEKPEPILEAKESSDGNCPSGGKELELAEVLPLDICKRDPRRLNGAVPPPEPKPECEAPTHRVFVPVDMCRQDPKKAKLQLEQTKLLGAPVEAKRKHGGDGVGCEAPAAINPAFDTNLYQLLKADQGNVFFSPYSISECMGMVYAGAGGNTATEIAKALSYGKDAKGTAGQFKAMRNHLSHSLNQGDNKLRIANALCVTGQAPLQSYQDTVRQQFGGELFSGGLKKINNWAKKKTDGNIETILEELDPDSACVLLNAVYFKGNWKESFDVKKTHKADFRLPPGETVKVDMMTREGSYKVLRDKGLVAIELPYQTSASMVLIMPDKAEGMEALEKQFTEELLREVTDRLQGGRTQEVQLYMPKFKIKTSYDLIDSMKQLGMSDAFDLNKSDFKAMYGESRAAISQIKHKATLEVDELGSVATAVTAVEMKREKAVRHHAIRFNRPFMALIRDRNTGANLFMGRINDPTAK